MKNIGKLLFITFGFTLLWSCEPEALPTSKQGSEKLDIHALKPYGGTGDEENAINES